MAERVLYHLHLITAKSFTQPQMLIRWIALQQQAMKSVVKLRNMLTQLNMKPKS